MTYTRMAPRTEYEAVLLRDDPVTGLKAGDRMKCIYMGERWRRPTTVHGRLARPQHEPVTETTCLCGDSFTESADYLKHTSVWMNSWHRVRFRYRNNDGEQVASPIGGHQMAYRPSQMAGWGQVKCSCGWRSTSKRIRRPGPVAREHVRDVVRSRIGLEPRRGATTNGPDLR